MRDEVFDYVIVGAGSAGCVLAARLSASPDTRVALVEAGGEDKGEDFRVPLGAVNLLGSSSDWGYSTQEQDGLAGRRVYWPRGKVLGGSSSTNFQMWIPGHRLDYEAWEEAAGPSWSWETVRPYYRRTERWNGHADQGGAFGTGGPLWISPPRDPDPSTARFLEACAEAGLPPITGGLDGGDDRGATLTPLNQLRGTRWSAADGYLHPVRDRENLSVFTGETVRRVLLEGGRATGVELSAGRLTARREVILSAGTVGSPQLLMLSGIGDPDALRRAGVEPGVALDGVGRNLHDHVGLDVVMKATGPVRLARADTPANRRLYEQDRRGPLTSNMTEAVAFLRTDGAAGPPDVELIWAPVAFTDDSPEGTDGLTVAVVLLQPDSRGTITLATADPSAPPLIDPGYLTEPSDLKTFVAGVRFAERLFETQALRPLVDGALAPWRGGLDDETLARTVRERAQTLFHPVGTCRMGHRPDEGAVVDSRLKVHGVEGLRVADASVVPRITRGHTHAPAVMIGERAADLVLRDARL
ncbi:GMC family oxidoreductase N-terminal domain-containing protein [Streptomyces sp. NPDC046316]|uniref:GMC family oxidoreductase n=1 Tax=Streptomyces sp. NPDC046316 TaxID=3154494 RepID=UPI00340A22B4